MTNTPQNLLHEYLPHRAPMLMVDEFASLSEEEIHAKFDILPDTLLLDNEKLSEAGLLEHMAQSASIIIGKRLIDEQITQNTLKPLIGFISQIKKANIHSLPSVGNTLHTHATLGAHYGSICHVYCQSHCEGMCIATAEITLLITSI